MKILLLGVDFDNPNQGVNALLFGTLAALTHRFPEGYTAKVLMIAGKSSQRRLRIRGQEVLVQTYKLDRNTLLQSIGKIASLTPLPFGRNSSIFRNDPIIRLFDEADFVIDLSAGDSFSDTYGLPRLLVYFLFKLPALALRKPLYIFPQTLGPFRYCVSKVIAKYIFERARLIFTREPYSTDIVRTLIKDAQKVVEASDMAFLMEPEPVELQFLREHPDFIGVNVSGLLYFENKPDLLKWTSAEYQAFMRDVVIQFVQKFNKQVLLVPHVIFQGTVENDVEANWQLLESLPEEIKEKTEVITTPFSAPQLKHIINRSEFFVGARMHACIAALSSCVPVTPVSYSHKFEGILRQLSLEYLVCDPLRSSGAEMLAHIGQCYENREQIQKRLKQVIPLAQHRALECVNLLR